MTTEQFLGLYNYWIVIFLMMTGFYIVIARGNMVKTIIGLNIFQTSVFLLYITMGKVRGGTAPIIPPDLVEETEHAEHAHAGDAVETLEAHAGDALQGHDATDQASAAVDYAADHSGHAIEHASDIIYSHPLPSVLMLTAIVVGIATTALALALIVRIREDYGSIEEDEVLEMDRKA